MIVHLHLVRGHQEESRLTIDGIDITEHVLAEGLTVTAEPCHPKITLALRPDVLDIEVTGPAGDIIQRLHTEASTGATP